MTASKVSVEHDSDPVAWASPQEQCFRKCGRVFAILRTGMRMSDDNENVLCCSHNTKQSR